VLSSLRSSSDRPASSPPRSFHRAPVQHRQRSLTGREGLTVPDQDMVGDTMSPTPVHIGEAFGRHRSTGRTSTRTWPWPLPSSSCPGWCLSSSLPRPSPLSFLRPSLPSSYLLHTGYRSTTGVSPTGSPPPRSPGSGVSGSGRRVSFPTTGSRTSISSRVL